MVSGPQAGVEVHLLGVQAQLLQPPASTRPASHSSSSRRAGPATTPAPHHSRNAARSCSPEGEQLQARAAPSARSDAHRRHRPGPSGGSPPVTSRSPSPRAPCAAARRSPAPPCSTSAAGVTPQGVGEPLGAHHLARAQGQHLQHHPVAGPKRRRVTVHGERTEHGDGHAATVGPTPPPVNGAVTALLPPHDRSGTTRCDNGGRASAPSTERNDHERHHHPEAPQPPTTPHQRHRRRRGRSAPRLPSAPSPSSSSTSPPSSPSRRWIPPCGDLPDTSRCQPTPSSSGSPTGTRASAQAAGSLDPSDPARVGISRTRHDVSRRHRAVDQAPRAGTGARRAALGRRRREVDHARLTGSGSPAYCDR